MDDNTIKRLIQKDAKTYQPNKIRVQSVWKFILNYIKERRKLLVVFAVLFMLTGCGSKVEMKDYFIYEINGTNGEGFLMGNLDVSNLTTDALDIKIDSFEDLFSEKAAEAMKFEMSIGYDVDKTSQLSNGDEITVNFTVSDEFKKKVGTSPLKIKVKDLD